MATQNIVIDVAGESAGVGGVSRQFAFEKISPTPPLVTLSIDDNTGITTWAWELLSRPTGSSSILGTPTSSTTTFTPTTGIPGTYLIRCTLNGTILLANVAVAWRSQFGDHRYPAVGETIEFDADRGWEPAVQGIFDSIEDGTVAGRQRFVADYSTSTVLTESTFVGTHRTTNAAGDVKLTLPVITAAMLGKKATIVKWGAGNCHFQPGAGNTIADGADATIVLRNSVPGQAKVAQATVTAISITEWAWSDLFGSWATEPA